MLKEAGICALEIFTSIRGEKIKICMFILVGLDRNGVDLIDIDRD